MGRTREKRSQSTTVAAADVLNAKTGATSTEKPSSKRSILPSISSSSSSSAVKLPQALRFPILVILSFSLSASLYSFAADATGYELAGVSRRINDSWQVGGLLFWKVCELAIGWYRDYDDLDLSSLTILSHSPYFFLLNQCYDIRLRTCMMCLGIDVVTTALPFRLLRSRTSTHSTPPTTGSSSRGSGAAAAVTNRAVVHDRTVRLCTWLLATCIYSTVVLLSSRTWLPSFLVVHFDGLRSLARLHASEIPRLLLFMSPLGWAMQDFVFTAVTTAVPTGKDGRAGSAPTTSSTIMASSSSSTDMSSFDPASATLSETFWYNVFFWRRWDGRTKVLLERMVTVVAVAAVNTSAQTFNTLEGADISGAVGWAGMWAVANVVVSFVFGWVGDV